MHSGQANDHGLSIRYALEKAAFSLDVDVEFAMQGITGVFGPSGAGKTTLLRCIAGLEKPDSGRLVANGSVWEDTDTQFSRAVHERRVGYVFQEARLFPHINVRGNLRYGQKRTTADKSGIDLDQAVALLGLESLLERAPGTLSGGEAQRVAIGRALLRGPELLLMDEPLASIDETRREEVLPFIERLHASVGVPIVYVSHNIDEICRICDQLAVMDGGRISTHGRLQSILLQTEVPFLSGREAGAVIDATVESFDSSDGLTRVLAGGCPFWVPGEIGSAGSELRLRVRADDVSVCLERPQQTSILNVLEATIKRIQKEPSGTALLHLRVGSEVILARVTQKSCADLSLTPGKDLFAQVKSIAVRSSLN
jgi:molybdate transport system ATP-binding protein